MKRLIVNDWAWMNCITKDFFTKNIGGLNYGESVVSLDNDCVAVYKHIWCDIVKETEKAVQIEFEVHKIYTTAQGYGSLGKSFKWHAWIPKKAIINNEELKAFNYLKTKAQIDSYLSPWYSKNKVKNTMFTW